MQQLKQDSNQGKSKNLTATQLRNARKRRAKQKQKEQQQHKRQRTDASNGDPSLKYIQQPTQAPIVQQAKQFFATRLEKFDIVSGPQHNWRTLVKLAVRYGPTADCEAKGQTRNHGKVKNVKQTSKRTLCLGLFAPKSHNLIPDSCTSPLHHPVINQAMEKVQHLARRLHVAPFEEGSQLNDRASLKYVTASLERSTKKVQLTLIWQETKDSDNTALEALCQTLLKETSASSVAKNAQTDEKGSDNTLFQSLWVHYHPFDFSTHNNSIYAIDGGRWETIFGPSHGTREQIPRVQNDGTPPTLYFPPNVFRQANIDGFSQIVQEIQSFLHKEAKTRKEQTKPAPRLLELYGGVGTIGLNLAHFCSDLICSDENPNNRACFEKSIGTFGDSKISDSCRYVPHNATDMVRGQNAQAHLHQADWIVVDPPRKGLESEVCQSLCTAQAASVLVYVSCGFPAFVRDYQQLTRGGWKCCQASGHVLFPGSDAIETLAFFRYSP